MIKKIQLLLLLIVSCSTIALSQDSIAIIQSDTSKPVDLSEMSLEDLLKLTVTTGSLVNTGQYATPVSVTVITEKDILVSAARNLLDVMEMYVPGFFWMDHGSEGQRTGMRGIISDRNLKILLLVNGVVINQKAHRGLVEEISEWDMNDIEKVEVIRGPGSVTYGPGAIQGVVNIITKRAKDDNGTRVGVNYVGAYKSKGFFVSQNVSNGKTKAYLYGSLQSTEGYEANTYKSVTSSNYGYLGQIPNTNPSNLYFQDGGKVPQLKLMADIDFGKGWIFNTRYVQSGNSATFGEQYKPLTNIDSAARYLGARETGLYLRHQQYTAFVEKKLEINNNFSATVRAIYSNENNVNTRRQSPTYVAKQTDTVDVKFINSVSDVDHLRNKYASFSEEQITGKAVGYYTSDNNKFRAALGIDIVRNTWRAPWGGKSTDLRMGDRSNILNDSITSPVIGSSTTFGLVKASDGFYVGKGWSTNTVSLYGEGKYSFSKLFSIMISGRVDKDSYSSWLFSPRIAFISEISRRHHLRLVVLQSNRMNTAEQMLIQHSQGIASKPEKIKGGELLYTFLMNKKLTTDLSIYYNINNVLSWSTAQLKILNTGESKTGGIEASVNYTGTKINFGLNHAYVKLFDWKLSDGVTGSGISYSEYNVPVTYKDANNVTKTVKIQGNGKNLSNYSNNITKVYVNYSLWRDRIILHADSRILWGFEGTKDGLKALQAAFDTVNAPIKNDINNMVNDMNSRKLYGTDMRLNASITFKYNNAFSFTFFVQNLASTSNAKRYFYDSGLVSATAPSKIAYVEEPRTYGAKASFRF